MRENERETIYEGRHKKSHQTEKVRGVMSCRVKYSGSTSGTTIQKGQTGDSRGLSLSKYNESQIIYTTVNSFRTGDYSPSTDCQPMTTRRFPAQGYMEMTIWRRE
ncbi:hypothetical protein VN97_g1939 [Penicillium thymicola]|uniref:Uncharacterized protein n=1 Tax=Penicillium thymicola TaxID=293382 RepID=A0AAI9TQU1_PENTH|nr:hypothetical protein VN97_g1939 [Penicillium thymicola]